MNISKIFKYTWAPTLVAIIIFYLCCLIPQNNIPQVDFDFIIPTDKLVHFTMFWGLAITASFSYIYTENGHIIILNLIAFTILLPILYGGLIELIQTEYFTGRNGDWYDFIADMLGAISSIPLSLWFRRYLLNQE